MSPGLFLGLCLAVGVLGLFVGAVLGRWVIPDPTQIGASVLGLFIELLLVGVPFGVLAVWIFTP